MADWRRWRLAVVFLGDCSICSINSIHGHLGAFMKCAVALMMFASVDVFFPSPLLSGESLRFRYIQHSASFMIPCIVLPSGKLT